MKKCGSRYRSIKELVLKNNETVLNHLKEVESIPLNKEITDF